ncbi:uncharacterized protein [Haliotis asinina]|uniref:uncharacterized protein n=1 Tax=Haliotis asinina TaxID=109174 RepID=UPI003531B6DF
MLSVKGLPFFLLVVLVSSQSDDIPDKVQTLLTLLYAVNIEVRGLLDVTNSRCPCLDDVTLIGNETFQDVQCYETKVEVFRNDLRATITFVEGLKNDSSTACPERTGSLLVASCDSPVVSEVDPNGAVQNGFEATTNISGWTVGPFTNDSFEYDYFSNNPFVLRCRLIPDGPEVILANSSVAPLAPSASGTGIAYFAPTNEIYVAITHPDNAASNGIYAFNRTSFPNVRLVFPYSGETGSIYISGSYVYMLSNQTVLRIQDGETAWSTVVVWSLPPIAFAVQDSGNLLFCEDSGALYLYEPDGAIYRQLKQPVAGESCSSIAVGPDGSTIYYAVQGSNMIEVFNTSAPTAPPSTLEIATDSPCPILLLDPRNP